MTAYNIDMPNRWPNLQALELFIAVVDNGSLGSGARHVGIAQPNASRLLTQLESATKTSLLDRGPRGSTPTDAGLMLAEQARDLLDSAQQFESWLQAHRGEGSLELRVGASMTIAENLLPAWLAELRRRIPRVRVDVRVLNSAQVLAKVQNGELQLGFVETPHTPVRLNTKVVHEDELVVVVDPSHEWAARHGKISLQELAKTPLVVRERGSGTREALEELLSELAPVEPAQVLNSNAAVRVAVASGAGPAALSRLALRSQLSTGELLRVPVDGRRVTRPLTAVWHGPRRLRGTAYELVAVADATIEP